jgi:hypothetical protein
METVAENILFQNQFLAVVERDGYTFSREVRFHGTIMVILPFRTIPDASRVEFLARRESCPAHGPDLEYCSLIVGLEPGQPLAETACLQLLTEAGYRTQASELIDLGVARPSKSTDTVAHLFAVEVTGKTPTPPTGEDSKMATGTPVEWVNAARGLQITDPLFVTALARLQTRL